MDDEKTIATGIATQNPNDQDIKIEGQKFALENALEDAELNKPQRTEIWNEFARYSKAANNLIN